MEEIFLTAKKISKRYGGVLALDNVDLTIRTGEIHCLVGENGSGKSTLVRIISGVVQPEPAAEIEIAGERVRYLTPLESFQRGIQVVHQDLSLFPNLTIAENIAATRYIEKGQNFISWKNIRRIAEEATGRLGIKLDLDAPVGSIPIADQQLVAICRALASNARLLIMDEPTSSLTKDEVDRLFNIVRDLQSKGIATLFISHKLDEILEIGQRITVLRNGRKVGTFEREEVDKQKLVYLMTGKEISYSKRHMQGVDQDVVLEVRNLSKRGHFRDINFKLHRGEVLGIIGPLGSGRTELALSLFGMLPPDSGEVFIEQEPVKIKTNMDAIESGIGYVPEDRLTQGLVLNQTVENNLTITALDKFLNKLGLIIPGKKREFAEGAVERFKIKVPSIDSPVRTLSGGNQQRTVIAKWVSIKPKILILDGPTIGIDVAAKESIYDIIEDLASQGVSIILISDEVPEVLYNCNRVLLMKKGRIVEEFHSSETTEEELYHAIVK